MTLREIIDHTTFKCHRCNVPIQRTDISIHERLDAYTFELIFRHHGAIEEVTLPHLRAGGLNDARALGAFIATIKPFSTVAAPKKQIEERVTRLIRFED